MKNAIALPATCEQKRKDFINAYEGLVKSAIFIASFPL